MDSCHGWLSLHAFTGCDSLDKGRVRVETPRQRLVIDHSQIHKRSFQDLYIKSLPLAPGTRPGPYAHKSTHTDPARHPRHNRTRNRLEPLGLGLRLRSLNRSIGIGVLEPAPLLPVLELGPDARAHTGPLPVVRAAALLAVGIRDAAARGELLAVAVADGRGARIVGLDLREGSGGDWGLLVGGWGIGGCRRGRERGSEGWSGTYGRGRRRW